MNTERNLTHLEKALLHIYYLGIEEDINGTDEFKKTLTIKKFEIAYGLGKQIARKSPIDYLNELKNNEEILNNINQTYIIY
jgi:hypothetical protein